MVFRLIAMIAVVACAVSAGCASDNMVRAQAARYHESLTPVMVDDSTVDAYLDAIGRRIVAAARAYDESLPENERNAAEWMFTDVQFRVLANDEPNAFATGGTTMYVHKGLIDLAESEDELAAVMCHEFGHVYGRHIHKSIDRRTTVMIGSALAGAAGAAASNSRNSAAVGQGLAASTATIGGLVILDMSRDDEAEADALGFEFYTRAGWDPHKFDDFFQRMIDKGYGSRYSLLSSHPPLEDRVAAAQQRAAAYSAHTSNARFRTVRNRDFEDLKRRVARVSTPSQDDEDVQVALRILAAHPGCLGKFDTKK